MNKSELRTLFLQWRRELSSEETKLRTLSVVWNFPALSYEGIKYLHIFYPIEGKSEFNTLLLVNWFRNMHPEIELVLSKSDFRTNTLLHFIWEAGTALTANEFGIIEPVAGTQVDASELDMIVIPLLAYDQAGNRVGYGKGFYDRFLAGCRPDAQKIGVSLFEPVEAIDDINEFDMPLDMCVSPEGIWKFE